MHTSLWVVYILLLLFSVNLFLLYFLRWRVDKQICSRFAHREQEFIRLADNVRPKSMISSDVPSVSIVVPTIDQADQLKRILPILLEQNYAGRFEVIVVDQKSTDFTGDYMEGFSHQYEHLRYVQLPETLRYITLRKIAITLGVKAARNEWIILINPETFPLSKDWLCTFSGYFQPQLCFLSAYYNYYDDDTLLSKRAILERVKSFNIRLSALKNGYVLGCETSNLAFRKSFFLAEGGFSDNLNLPFGEETLFANHHVQSEQAQFVVDPQLLLEEQNPTAEVLNEKRIQNLETDKYRRTPFSLYSSREYFVSVIVLIQLIIILLYLFVRVKNICSFEMYNTAYIHSDLIFLFIVSCYYWGTTHFIGCSLKVLHLPVVTAYLWTYDVMFIFHRISLHLQRFRHRKEFVRNYM